MALPLFTFLDAQLQQLQTQWASALNPVIDLFKRLNTQPPQITVLTSGSGIYKVPKDTFYLEVMLVGAGGGGVGSGTSLGNAAGDGGDSLFGIKLLIANGGKQGVFQSTGGLGGKFSLGNLSTAFGIQGGSGTGFSAVGGAGSTVICGQAGGNSALGGGGGGGDDVSVGLPAAVNSGGGGGSGGCNVISSVVGASGGAGGFVHAFITDNLQKTYPYSIGIAGIAGAAGTSGFAGGAGGSGIVIVKAFFQ